MSPHVLGLLGGLLAKHARNISSRWYPERILCQNLLCLLLLMQSSNHSGGAQTPLGIIHSVVVSGLHDSFCPSLFFGSSPAAGLNAEMPVKTRLIVSGVLFF